MTYRIQGLSPEPFMPLLDLDDDGLAARNARRVVADSPAGFPCRVSLEEALPGEEVLLVNHVSQPAATPFRASHAIYVRRGAEPADFVDSLPAMFAKRTLSLRAFDAAGMLVGGELAPPGDHDGRIRALFAQPGIAEIHVHSAAYGCFLARIERD
ncbi:MAG: DUF1203 domain-containing protein [Sphingosinicella sp.]